MRYNRVWVVDFLPNRTEYMVIERKTSDILVDGVIELERTEEAVTEFINSLGIKIFSLNVRHTGEITNFVGKGLQ